MTRPRAVANPLDRKTRVNVGVTVRDYDFVVRNKLDFGAILAKAISGRRAEVEAQIERRMKEVDA